MNYRHAFHAGNFADVFKHALLTRILLRLAAKPAAFRVLDTHAGDGLYDLRSDASVRTGEWRDGIGRLLDADLPPGPAALLQPYKAIVASYGEGFYPGSPLVTASLLRRGDRLVCCELLPAALKRLRQALPKRGKVLELDGYLALKAQVPPVERRGLVLIDPPFEDPEELTRLRDAVSAAWRKWSTGIFAIWLPLKSPDAARSLAQALIEAGVPKLLRLELWTDAWQADERLAGTALIVINPPFGLDEEATVILPALADVLGRSSSAGWQAEGVGLR